MGSKKIHLIHYFKRKDKVLICTGEDLIKICNITSKGTIQDIREMKMVADKVSTAVIFNEQYFFNGFDNGLINLLIFNRA